MANIPQQEKVSVIIPLYNARDYVEQTITSILEQSFTDFRLYIIDDHSTDGSADVAKEYQKRYPEKITYFRPETAGKRPATGKNIGIKMSKGTYVALMDHDDWWEPNHLQLLVEAMEGDSKIGLVGANAIIYDNQNKKSLGKFRQDPSVLAATDIHRETLFEPPFPTSSCMMFRREVLDKIGIMDEALFMSDDHEIAMRIVLDHTYKVVALPTVTIYRRWHENSLSNLKDSITVALDDASHIYRKFINRPDITEEERSIIENWYQTVRRRWANYLISVGEIKQGREIYSTLSSQGKFAFPVLLIKSLLAIAPPLAQKVVSAKRQWSFRHPHLR